MSTLEMPGPDVDRSSMAKPVILNGCATVAVEGGAFRPAGDCIAPGPSGPVPLWVTLKLRATFAEITTWPCRNKPVGLTAAAMRNHPLPTPLTPSGKVIHGAAVDAVHVQPGFDAVT